MAVTLTEDQAKAVKDLGNGKILYGKPGSGKSITACAYYMENEAHRNVIVITTALKRDTLDWEEEFSHFGVTGTPGASMAGLLTVDSWNNIEKYKEVKDAFFIFDEQRVVGSGAWVKGFIKIAKGNRWILLSGTPGDTWLDYIPVFVANGFYANRTAFKDQHVIIDTFSKYPKVKRYINTGRLVRLRNELLVKMPDKRHTIRHIHNIDVDHDETLLEKVTKKRWNIFTEKPLRDVAELFRVARRLVNSDPTRLSTVATLWEKHPRLIVFYNFDYELELLRTLASAESSLTASTSLRSASTEFRTCDGASDRWNTGNTSIRVPFTEESTSPSRSTLKESLGGFPDETTSLRNEQVTGLTKSSTVEPCPETNDGAFGLVAEWNGHRHDPLPTGDRWLYLVQYTAGSEGWNCTTTDATVFYSLTYSYRAWSQAHGRIDRLNTPYTHLFYYVLMSKSWIDKAIWKALREKKNFNESSVAVKS